MSKGWKEVARLGVAGSRYPHILVDAHGWCLRMGTRPRTDEKYYSNLPSLFQGLLEHSVRRRLMEAKEGVDLKGFADEVRGTLRSTLDLCLETLREGRLEAPARGPEAQEVGAGDPSPPSPSAAPGRHPGAPGGQVGARPVLVRGYSMTREIP